MGRGVGTISDIINKNGGRERFDPDKAFNKSRNRKHLAHYQQYKVQNNKELRAYVIAGLEQGWNPDEIAGSMRVNKLPFYASKTAIYEWLRSVWGQRYCKYLATKRASVKKHREKARAKGKVVAPHIPNRINISKRPCGANNRTRYGHGETDTVTSKKGAPGGMKTLIERKSRYLQASLVATMKPQEHADALAVMEQEISLLTITYDNGLENIYHEQSATPSYFCDPYSSHQKGAIEHANGMLRRRFPKGTDFSTVTQAELDEEVNRINEKPRRSNGYRSARYLAEKAGIIKSKRCSS